MLCVLWDDNIWVELEGLLLMDIYDVVSNLRKIQNKEAHKSLLIDLAEKTGRTGERFHPENPDGTAGTLGCYPPDNRAGASDTGSAPLNDTPYNIRATALI